MNDASDLDPDQRSPSAPPDRLAIWYSQGLSDGLGDRLLMFDNTGAPSLELLRVRPELAARPEFEAALRQRVHRLRAFAHPSFALVRRVDHLEGNAALALVSNRNCSRIRARRRSPSSSYGNCRRRWPRCTPKARASRTGRLVRTGSSSRPSVSW